MNDKGVETMQEFRSKVDVWLVAVIVAAVGLTLLQSFMFSAVSSTASLLSLAAAVFVAGLFFAVGVPCKYVLEAEHLFIQSGFLKQRIAYRDIRKIELSSSPLAAPALSLKRVKISYGRSFQLVSPHERELFIQQLQARVAQAAKS